MRIIEAGAEPAIRTRGLVKAFGDVRALDGVDLEAAPGTVLGLLGPNGAGKTTTVRILTTLLRPDAGEVCVAGLDAVRDAAALRGRIGLAGQYAAVDENLTGAENLVMVGRLYGWRRRVARQRAAELLERFRLTDAAGRPVKTYSGGMRRRLDLAAALVARPPVLFLDEPTTGLDPRSRLDVWETVEALVADGTTVLLTTQYLDEADRLADRIAVIDRGRVIADGTGDELKTRVGGERLEVRLAHAAEAPAATAVLAPLAASPAAAGGILAADGASPAAAGGILAADGASPASAGGTVAGSLDADDTLVCVVVARRGRTVMDAARLLDRAGIAVEDIAVRRPTLDDVFLSLTGHGAAAEEKQEVAEAMEVAA
jgi:ABC-2 type transport system ATP-binding protein